MLLPILAWILAILLSFYVYLVLLKRKLWNLENTIIHQFRKKTDFIPSLYEVSRDYITKHDEIFHEILRLRKINFSETNDDKKLHEIIKTQWLIHNELNFIFKVSNKHQKMLREWKFIYLRDIIINRSGTLSENIKLYKKIVAEYNHLIKIKNLSIIWLFLPIWYIETI